MINESLIRELETLSESQQADVLAFIRFLKIGMADRQAIEQGFADALAQARAIAKERGITQDDIDTEIAAVRAKQ